MKHISSLIWVVLINIIIVLATKSNLTLDISQAITTTTSAITVHDNHENEDEKTNEDTHGESSFIFTKPSYNVSIAENSPSKTYTICNERMGIHISDPSLVVRYKILAGDDDKIFKAETKHVGDFYFLLIRTRSGDNVILNREYRAKYELRIRATITSLQNESLRFKSRCIVFVNIIDTNDLSPIFFPEKYEINLAENVTVDSIIAKVSAFDPDIDLNGEIYYSLAENSLMFAVHPTRGSISVTRPLAIFENKGIKQYQLTVLAKDRGFHHSREILDTSKAKVKINIFPVNKYEPKIIFAKTKRNSTFGSQKNIYATFNIEDDDEGEMGEICSVKIIHGNDLHLFSLTKLNSHKYNIERNRQFKNATIFNVNLTVQATDCGGAFSTQSIIINDGAKSHLDCLDLPDHLNSSIHEVALVGTQIMKITCLPLKESKHIFYSIIDGNDNSLFDISSNGVVFTSKMLDYELQNMYTLIIKAQVDESDCFKTTQLKINIIDDNDNKPLFEVDKSPISVVFDENHQNGSLVYRIIATDADSGDNAKVSYTLANPSGTVPFSIDHSTGEIRTTKKLDYESSPHQYQIFIRASDWGEPYRRQTQISLNFTLKDVNDHRPQFEKRNCTAYIPINTKPMTEIITLSATDLDEGTSIKYKMFSPNFERCFNLDENTGVLRLICNLNEETDSGFIYNQNYINVSATDGQHFSDVMGIKVVMINDEDSIKNKNKVMVNCDDAIVSQKPTMYKLYRQHINGMNSEPEKIEESIPTQNLNKPEFDSSVPKEIYLPENTEIGRKILKVLAKDPDHGFDGMLVWALNSHALKTIHSDKIVFNIDPFTGEIYVIDNIDYEQHSKYKLHIIVCDLGSPQLCATHTLFIIIEDLNDNSPVITNYEFNVPEDSESGYIIGQLHATDDDDGSNSMLTYHLSDYNQDTFAMDPKNGTLFLKSNLDRETIDRYVLYVYVHDSGLPSLTSTSTVTVNVLDVNDNPPKFHQDVYLAKVREDLPVGTVIMKMKAFDLDTGHSGKIYYSMKSDKFSIDPLMGNIRIMNELDFEKTKHYSLTVTAKDEGTPILSSTASLIVEVEDVNENYNPPRFPEFVVSASVKENSPIGSLVTNVTAIDEDGSVPPIYQIVGGDGLGRFRIDENGGIFTSVMLDRETNSRYWITVMASDRSPVPLSSFCEVYIEILNENDEAPITTEPFYYVKVNENASIGSSLLQIEAYDPDFVEYKSPIRFRILNDVPFSVEQSGLIRTRGKLDCEVQSRYIIDVEVSETNINEEVEMTLFTKTPIIVTVNDVNEFEPQALRTILRCQSYNTIQVNDTICQIVAFDHDATKCNLIYKVIEGNELNRFRVEKESGVIISNQDSIPKGEYELVVSVFDCGLPSKSSQVRILIKILQTRINQTNHEPKIEMSDNKISISEHEEIGYAVVIIKAVDEDNDKLCFYIVSGNTNNTFAFQDAFQNTGALVLAKNIDYETQNQYNLTIMVTDGINSSFANLTVNLVDFGDNLVSFSQDAYNVDVLENTTIGSEILHLNPNKINHLYFTIYSSRPQESLKYFDIESWSGRIKLKEKLDYETRKIHYLVVEVSDKRNSLSHDRAFAIITINVLDVNDEVPTFISSNYEANIPESASIGTSIVKVQAIDNDSGIYSLISYSIVSGNVDNVFGINPDDGLVFLAKPLNIKHQSEYYLILKGSDKSLTPLSSTTNVHITVYIPEYSRPQFDQSVYKTNIKENERIGKPFFTLKASSKQLLYYQIINGNEKDEFSINPYNGEIYLKNQLDFEAEKSYQLTISATNLVGLNDTAKLSITILDVNDVMPYWNQTYYIGYILESAPVGSIVLNDEKLPLVIKAYDGDSMNNAILIYSINEDSARQYFDINSRTGVISLAKQMDYEKVQEFNFTISVTDIRPPSLKALTNAFVQIHCIPVNDCPPVLTMSHYQTTLLLPTLKNVIVTQISATDCDHGNDGQHLEYILKHQTSLSENKFQINSTTGTIFTADDKINEGLYEMNVIVSDGIFNVEAKLTVIAEKLPKSSLKFTHEKFTGHILENSNEMKKILSPAIEGIKLNEHLSFRILNPSENFRIDKISGSIYNRGIPIDREQISKFELLIEVQSIFIKSRVAHCLVEIIVDDINDNRPIFVGLPYYFVFSMESPSGTQVGKIQAIDLDIGDNAFVTYSLLSGDPKTLFNINSETGQISLSRKVDPLSDLMTYHLIVKAIDFGFPSLESQTNITIKIVLGTNDKESLPDLNTEIKPISFQGNSYARYGLIKPFGKISLRFRTQQIRSVIFYQIGIRTFSILEIAGGFIQYRFDCGSGEGLIRVENFAINKGKWHEVSIERKGNSASITLDNKFRSNGFAPSSSGDCPSFLDNDLYFGGEVKPRPTSIGGEDILNGFIGCLDNILIDDNHLPLHVTLQSKVAILKIFTNVEFNCNFKTDIEVCKSQPCLNGGSCHALNNGSFHCSCLSTRFAGSLCEIDLAPCNLYPCMNGGICFQDKDLCIKGIKPCHKCDCPPGYSGLMCEQFKYCSNSLCQNNGVCEESSSGPKCKCQPGWNGPLCQYDIDECKFPSVCQPPATCFNIIGSFRCICPVNSTSGLCTDTLYATNILSSPLNITFDEIIGIFIIFVILSLSGCIIACCWRFKNKSRRNRTPNNYRDEFLLKNQSNHNDINLKRFSKISNYEITNTTPINLPMNRPTSFTETLNNFDTVRSYGSAADELETIARPDFIQNLKKNTSLSPIKHSLSPSPKHSISDKNEKIQNDIKSTSSCKISHNRTSICESDYNVLNEDQTANTNNVEGYHWDCSDWVMTGAAKPIANILEVSVNEIHDSESNSDNSQIELLVNDSHDKTINNNCDSHERTKLLLNDDLNEIEFVDKSEPTSPQKYLDMYLPRLVDHEWSNDERRRNIGHYTMDSDYMNGNDDNLSVSVLNFNTDDSNINVCEIEDDDYDYNVEPKKESTFL